MNTHISKGYDEMTRRKILKTILAALCLMAQPLTSLGAKAPAPLYPLGLLIAEDGYDTTYPSVAGDFLVYSKHRHNGDDYSVERVSKHSPRAGSRRISPSFQSESIRYGVAVDDGSIGYVSNRIGPLSAWIRQGQGDGHVLIGGRAIYTGALATYHLNASANGQVWCFDATMEKKHYNVLLSSYQKVSHIELLGQQWRLYDSNFFRHKMSYVATRAGNLNTLNDPSLFIVDRKSNQTVMIPNAFDGAISPDGTQVAFVRQTSGNYDIWMQDITGSELVQLTSSPYGDFEPAWSPDGKKLLFVSNRSSDGNVRNTSIYMLDLSDNRIKRLTNAKSASDGGPAWFDAHTVAFHSNRDLYRPQRATASNWNIWRLKLK
jgi:Tol biopolymer transport system component